VNILLAIVLLLPQTVTMAKLYPHLLSYYSESVGGLPGATKLGLETTYWCETYLEAIEYINQNAKKGDFIWAEWWSEDVLVYYQKHGYLRDDLKLIAADPGASIFGPNPKLFLGSYQSATWVIFQYRQTMLGEAGYENEFWKWVEKQTPVYRLEFQGVPLMDIYHR
jgi:hypothetical protein